MLQIERTASIEDALRAALGGNQAGLWTALPAIIQSFDASALTCTAQPAIQAQVRAQDGSTSWVTLPLLVDVPVCFPRGGGCTLTFPVASGDEALIVFASRCIDAWWQSGGVQVQAELRMHDLSDGFAILGPFSQAMKIDGVSTSAVQLRSNDGSAYIELNPSSKAVKVVAPGGFEVDAPTITLNGQLAQGTGSTKYPATLQGPITVVNDVTAAGKSVSTHTHHENGAGSNTNPPN
ncbi:MULTISPECIES: Gp138 family membrane-puncturing spike protein [unclassified Caballeronia]|uniref:Gp138 family membrane-puncturing spike protein n=1 Tax=unclassified Caballeronia TaxID=2646786 RepID=UPI00202955FC|nr:MULTISPECIES: Gp138 family membrane-puncturing spike protein [unclassified Caballeronia]